MIQHLFQEELYHIHYKAVVVLAKPWEDHSPEDVALLSKILGSVKLSLASVHIVVKPTVMLQSLADYPASKILLFGSQIDQEIKAYENVSHQNFSVIRADDLGQLDDTKKRNLWLALRQMFGV